MDNIIVLTSLAPPLPPAFRDDGVHPYRQHLWDQSQVFSGGGPRLRTDDGVYHRYFQHAHVIPIVVEGKRGAYKLVHGDLPSKAALDRNYLEVYWPGAGGISAVNAIGTQLRDPINSGRTRWRLAI